MGLLGGQSVGACLVSCSQTLTDAQGLITFSISAHAVIAGTYTESDKALHVS